MRTIYAAYGSNINIEQMQKRCPKAITYKTGVLKDYELCFNSVATVRKKVGYEVPILLWRITSECERTLDRYEGFPYLYYKEIVEVSTDCGDIPAMVYILGNGSDIRPPNDRYFEIIKEGYEEVGLDLNTLQGVRQRVLTAVSKEKRRIYNE